MEKISNTHNFVNGHIKTILRLEGLVVLFMSLMFYKNLSHDWKTFFILFLLPDISLFGYLLNKKIGAITYNVTHSYCLPLSLVVFALYRCDIYIQSLAFIWVAHIGFDRFLGYGLKYAEGFHCTHLGILTFFDKKK